jgi:hypothetical protein
MPLVTMPEVKAYLGITDTTQDVKLQLILESLDTWLKEEFKSFGLLAEKTCSITEYQDGPGIDRLITRYRPIISVASVHVSDNQVWDATTLIAASDYRITNSTGIIRLVSQATSFYVFPYNQPYGSLIFPRGVQNIRIIYNAGFDPTPADIRLSLLTVIGKHHAEISDASFGAFSSERLGDYSYTLASPAPVAEGGLGASGAFMIKDLRMLLDHYLKATFVA